MEYINHQGTQLASTMLRPKNNTDRTWLHRWIYYLAAGLMFIAASLRAVIILRQDPILVELSLLLATWLGLFIANLLLVKRYKWSSAVFISLEMITILAMLVVTGEDFPGFLYAICAMQAMQQYSPRLVAGLLAVDGVLIFLSLLDPAGLLQALALAIIYSAVSAFMAAYIWFVRQARAVQKQEQGLLAELEKTNEQLEFHTRQQEQLAAIHERQRLARELHDSVTQTIYSMTLTTRSALLLLEKEPGKVPDQLNRLDQLSTSAQAEMQELISRLAPESLSSGGFMQALQRLLDDRQRLDNLSVTLDSDGEQALSTKEEAGLFRITQEALNNIIKHANTSKAFIQLHLGESPWMEISDKGAGFDLQQEPGSGRMGLAGMKERAAEIGWGLRIVSIPGRGTQVRVEKNTSGGR